MKRIHLTIAPLLLVALAASTQSQAAVPDLINYQAYVTDAGGTPIGTGTPVNRTVVFRFWNHATDSADPNRLYGESQTVTINEGDFSVLIGQGTPTGEVNVYASIADVFAGAEVFLGITVDDGDGNLANDSEISPRQQIVTTAFAFRSKVAESVTDLAITTGMLAGNAVTENQLGPGAVTSAKLDTDAVSSGNIVNGTVASVDLANNAVTNNKILADAVTGAKIAPGTIQASDLQAGAVTGGFGGVIADGTVTASDLATDSVGPSEIATNAVGADELAANSVFSVDIVNGQVISDDLGFETITATLENLRIVRGAGSAAGSVGPVNGPVWGSGFTYQKTGGAVEVTFNTPFTNTPSVTANAFTDIGPAICTISEIGNNGFKIIIWDVNAFGVNSPFIFIAIGPR